MATDEQDHSLSFDVHCIFLECTRDRTGDGVLRSDATRKALEEFAGVVARRLAPRIGGRYITMRNPRLDRDRSVWAMFTGRNRSEVMREHKISRALFYSIMARKPRGF